MGNLFKDILGNIKTRIMLIIYLGLIVISTFFIIYGYISQVAFYEESELSRLKGIVSSLAVQIDGDTHEELMQKYKWMDGVSNPKEEDMYYELYEPMRKVQIENHLSTPIYTMAYNDEEKLFLFVVSSDSNMMFRHKYEMYPDVLLEKQDSGGVISRYETENGEWLSAFYPIRNSKNEVVALIQADIEFGQFKDLALKKYRTQGLVSTIVVLLMALLLIPYIRKILREDEHIKYELMHQKNLLEVKNRDINDSVNYASKIQEAMLPEVELITDLIPNSFVYYRPRDVVSGDFYWFKQIKNIIYIAVGDCTGHGIPGALMSMIGHAKLNAILHNEDREYETACIIKDLDFAVTDALSNKKAKTERRDGMDIGICKINLSSMELCFSGAFLNLIKINGEEITEYKANRFPVGGGDSYKKSEVTTLSTKIVKGDNFFMYSDGYPDQFGGPKEKKFLNKNFKKLLASLSDMDAETKLKILDDRLLEWRGDVEQVDDVLVVGLSF